MSYAINLTTPGGIELFRTKAHTWLFGAGATLNPDRVETYGDRTTAERVAEHIEADKRQQYGTDWHARAIRWALLLSVSTAIALGGAATNADAKGSRGARSTSTSVSKSSKAVSGGTVHVYGGDLAIYGAIISSLPAGKGHDPSGETQAVADGLKAPEGSELRHKAELCMVLGVRAQAACMAYRGKFGR